MKSHRERAGPDLLAQFISVAKNLTGEISSQAGLGAEGIDAIS
jgi:hypothetical protein